MAIYFFDTNSVAKCYVTETGSVWVRRTIDDDANSTLITAITLPELASALARMQRTGRFGKRFMRRSYTHFRSDIRKQRFYSHPLDDTTLQFASNLALKHPLRGYDAVQVATALLAQQKALGHPITFVTSDRQVLTVARDEGLLTEDPEQHPDPAEQPE